MDVHGLDLMSDISSATSLPISHSQQRPSSAVRAGRDAFEAERVTRRPPSSSQSTKHPNKAVPLLGFQSTDQSITDTMVMKEMKTMRQTLLKARDAVILACRHITSEFNLERCVLQGSDGPFSKRILAAVTTVLRAATSPQMTPLPSQPKQKGSERRPDILKKLPWDTASAIWVEEAGKETLLNALSFVKKCTESVSATYQEVLVASGRQRELRAQQQESGWNQQQQKNCLPEDDDALLAQIPTFVHSLSKVWRILPDVPAEETHWRTGTRKQGKPMATVKEQLDILGAALLQSRKGGFHDADVSTPHLELPRLPWKHVSRLLWWREMVDISHQGHADKRRTTRIKGKDVETLRAALLKSLGGDEQSSKKKSGRTVSATVDVGKVFGQLLKCPRTK